jgi:hypothetical protein
MWLPQLGLGVAKGLSRVSNLWALTAAAAFEAPSALQKQVMQTPSRSDTDRSVSIAWNVYALPESEQLVQPLQTTLIKV